MSEADIDDIAGEYVLGTLSLEERREIEARLDLDPALKAAVVIWQNRLAPLDESFDDTTLPPEAVWASIQQRIEASAASPDTPQILTPGLSEDDGDNNGFEQIVSFLALQKMRESRDRWRRLAIGTVSLAAGLIGLSIYGVNLPFLPQVQQEARFVAVLNPEGAEAGFLIRVDIDQKRLQIERLAGAAPQGKDYELWLIEPDNQVRSLDVVGREKVQRVGYQSGAEEQSLTFAISLEPEGGSPTGKATGPILYTGRLVTDK